MKQPTVIDILYFARFREILGTDKESLTLDESINTVADLIQQLSQRGAHWRETLSDNSVLIAVNQQICGIDRSIVNGDEVAFFPPVTGG